MDFVATWDAKHYRISTPPTVPTMHCLLLSLLS